MSERLTRKVGIIGASRLAATSINVLVASMFLSRYLDQAEYGTFQQTWFLTHMILEISLLGIPVGILYFLPKLNEEQRKGFLIRLGCGLLLIGILIGAAIYAAAPAVARSFHNPGLERTLRTFALYALFVLPGLPMDSFLITLNRHALLGVTTLIHSLLLVAAVILPASLGLALSTILWFLVGYGLLKSGLLVGATVSCMRGVRAESPRGLFRPFLLYSIPVGLNDLLRVVSRWLDKNIVSAYFRPETFAIYANGAIEIPFVNVFAGAISSVVIPEFSRLSTKGDRGLLIELWHRAILKTGALLIPLSVFLMVVAPAFLVVLFSERYVESAGPFRVYLLLLPLRSATYTPILLALGRSRLVALGALIDVLANLGLSILLIPHLSYLGPAVATVATTYGQAAFYLWWAGRILGVSWLRIFPWRGLGGLFLIAALPALLLPVLRLAAFSPLGTLLLAAMVYFPPLAVLLWRYGPLSEADREMVRRAAARLGGVLRVRR